MEYHDFIDPKWSIASTLCDIQLLHRDKIPHREIIAEIFKDCGVRGVAERGAAREVCCDGSRGIQSGDIFCANSNLTEIRAISAKH